MARPLESLSVVRVSLMVKTKQPTDVGASALCSLTPTGRLYEVRSSKCEGQCFDSAFRVVSSVKASESFGRLVTNGLTAHPKPKGMSRLREIDSHST